MTQRYYISRVGSEKTFNDLEAVREAAEHLANSNPGDEVLILKVVGTSIAPPRHATTTWLDKAPSPALPASWSPSDSALEEMISAIKPWSWPILPPGHSYLNPENLTVEQLGDGWRPLCTLDEKFPEPHEFLTDQQVWTHGVHRVIPPRESCSCDTITYRTRAPITATDSPVKGPR